MNDGERYDSWSVIINGVIDDETVHGEPIRTLTVGESFGCGATLDQSIYLLSIYIYMSEKVRNKLPKLCFKKLSRWVNNTIDLADFSSNFLLKGVVRGWVHQSKRMISSSVFQSQGNLPIIKFFDGCGDIDRSCKRGVDPSDNRRLANHVFGSDVVLE